MSKHTPGPWFILSELAMQREGMEPDEIAYELSFEGEFQIYAGDPVECTRGSLRGHTAHICDIDADSFDFDDDEETHKATALANARLIAAAPLLLSELKKARAYIAEHHASFVETVTNQSTGLIEDPDDVLAVKSDQEMLNGIDAAIAKGEQA